MKVHSNPFANILRLSVGDFIAKAFNFLTFIYLARILGVAHYGVLEFALSSSMYFLFFADAGLEGWAIREASKSSEIRLLAARILPLRFLLSGVGFLLLMLLLPFFPAYPNLTPLLILFGFSSFLQAANLKWSFLAHQKMSAAGAGLVLMQLVFGVMVFVFVRSPEDVLLVPVWKLLGELAMVVYFAARFSREYGGLPGQFVISNARETFRPAFIIGISSFLALMSFNFDSVLLGFFIGPSAVAWYNAAYKPVTVALAMPVTFFIGLFPVLSREYSRDQKAFEGVVIHSFRLTSLVAVPLAIGGTLLAKPIIGFLFGPEYANSIQVLQILVWSAALVILRGTFRQGLVAANEQGLDLRCALAATVCNVILNVILIPRYGVTGAAAATVIAEMIWLTMAYYYFNRRVRKVPVFGQLLKPLLAGIAMAAFLFVAQRLFWILQAIAASLIYFGVLFLLGEIGFRRSSTNNSPD